MADAGCVKVSHEGPVAVLSMEFAPHNLLGLDLMAGMRAGLNAAQMQHRKLAQGQCCSKAAYAISRLVPIPRCLWTRKTLKDGTE